MDFTAIDCIMTVSKLVSPTAGGKVLRHILVVDVIFQFDVHVANCDVKVGVLLISAEKNNRLSARAFPFGYHGSMDSAANIVEHVVHYVYTWLPKTAITARKRKKRKPSQKKRVRFEEPMNVAHETSFPALEVLATSSYTLPSVPHGSKAMLLEPLASRSSGVGRGYYQEFPDINLEIVGYKFISKEKKLSKRSALKRWLKQRTNAVHDQHFNPHEDYFVTRHDLCRTEIFQCSPRMEGRLLTLSFHAYS